MEMDKKTSIEIIKFLKEYKDTLEYELINRIEKTDNGFYIIQDEQITFSSEAKKLLSIDEPISLEHFYQHINLQDRMKLWDLLDQKKIEGQPYDVIYRYKIDHSKQIWIKEHGIFSYQNKKQRIALISNYTERMKQDKELHRLAYYDPTTHLKNRNYFDQDLQFLVNYKVPFSLLFIEITSHYLFNENNGILHENQILMECSKRIQECLERKTDFDLYRYSSQTFALIFPYLSSLKELKKITHAILEAYHTPILYHQLNISIVPKMGSVFYPKDAKQIPTLLKYANLSLKRARTDSQIHFYHFDRQYYKTLLEEQKLEEYIKQLMIEKNLQLKYQPIYDIKSNTIVALEALFHASTEINIEKMFTTALKSHLMIDLDCFILEHVIKDIKEYDAILPKSIRFTINITPKTIESIDFYKTIKDLLTSYQLSGSRVGIEITEQYFVDDESKVNILIEKLHHLGIKIYLDDFGMGYSSVRNLAYLNYDYIKLDKRIVSSVFENQKCDWFIKSIFQFAKDANINIIIEGVETKEQLDYIETNKGYLIQGFYLSKPVKIEQTIEMMSNKKE